ncbi:hypothetical protein LCGC14_0147440 [marine sediment metagenome]|uniref:Uncharacterized protein n=1 Tax=marine sediment metagenome TaxID=412755 RepID=A0A0F9VFR4_9ZZZZ
MDDPSTILDILKIGGPVLITVVVVEVFRWRERLSHRETIKELNETMQALAKTGADERKQWASDVREIFEAMRGLQSQALATIQSNTEVLSEFLTTIKERLPRGRDT